MAVLALLALAWAGCAQPGAEAPPPLLHAVAAELVAPDGSVRQMTIAAAPALSATGARLTAYRVLVSWPEGGFEQLLDAGFRVVRELRLCQQRAADGCRDLVDWTPYGMYSAHGVGLLHRIQGPEVVLPLAGGGLRVPAEVRHDGGRTIVEVAQFETPDGRMEPRRTFEYEGSSDLPSRILDGEAVWEVRILSRGGPLPKPDAWPAPAASLERAGAAVGALPGMDSDPQGMGFTLGEALQAFLDATPQARLQLGQGCLGFHHLEAAQEGRPGRRAFTTAIRHGNETTYWTYTASGPQPGARASIGEVASQVQSSPLRACASLSWPACEAKGLAELALAAKDWFGAQALDGYALGQGRMRWRTGDQAFLSVSWRPAGLPEAGTVSYAPLTATWAGPGCVLEAAFVEHGAWEPDRG
jgi:hypothetical protein